MQPLRNVLALAPTSSWGNWEEIARDLDRQDKSGHSALHSYALSGNKVFVSMLLEAGATVNICDRSGWTPLHYACVKNHAEIARMLLERGANPHMCDQEGRTALHRAALWGSIECLQLLLQHDADALQVDDGDETPVELAASSNNLECLKVLMKAIEKKSTNNNVCKSLDHRKKAQMLYRAIEHHNNDVSLLLLDSGVDLAFSSCVGANSFLHIAASEGNEELMECLLKTVAIQHLNRKNKGGFAPIHLACAAGHTDVIFLLIAANAVLTEPDDEGNLPLHLAAIEDLSEATVAILERHPHLVDARTVTTSKTALHIASEWGNTRTMKKLIKRGADVNTEDSKGHRALHLASSWGKHTSIQVLLQHGADPNAYDGSGLTPLHRAAAEGTRASVELLLAFKANPLQRDRNGNHLAKDYAFAHSHKHIGLLLVAAADSLTTVVPVAAAAAAAAAAIAPTSTTTTSNKPAVATAVVAPSVSVDNNDRHGSDQKEEKQEQKEEQNQKEEEEEHGNDDASLHSGTTTTTSSNEVVESNSLKSFAAAEPSPSCSPRDSSSSDEECAGSDTDYSFADESPLPSPVSSAQDVTVDHPHHLQELEIGSSKLGGSGVVTITEPTPLSLVL